jgi:chemotaxis signal transduction protein
MTTGKLQGFVVWALGAKRFASPLAMVERVLPALAIEPVPGAPSGIEGIATLGGRRVPVVDMRLHLRLRAREPLPSDHLVLVRTPRSRLAFFVDAVEGVEPRMDGDTTLVDGFDDLLASLDPVQHDA